MARTHDDFNIGIIHSWALNELTNPSPKQRHTLLGLPLDRLLLPTPNVLPIVGHVREAELRLHYDL